ncbi:MAG: class I SAM-dependent methyltransferase [Oligoflexia bacterium]|nr:class I SAM-dependent methyltransferase [Oligoflexia bacterium]
MSSSSANKIVVTDSSPASQQQVAALKALPPFELAEAYASADFEIPNLYELLCDIFSSSKQRLSPAGYGRLVKHIINSKLYNAQTGKGIFEVADAHYNLGNSLFECMLDPSMSYTCGYWERALTLEQSQSAKLDLCCRKLQLKPGMRVLDIGCGWGNFARFAAQRYQVHVTGLTISEEQARYARENCTGLPVDIEIRDYRDELGTYDRVVSIEMIEAVGKRNLPIFFESARRCLKDNGLFLLQAISAESVSSRSKPYTDDFYMWLVKYIFPNGYVPTLSELHFPCSNEFVIEHLENFGLDYTKTLLAWERNFSAAWPTISKYYDEPFRRRWRVYLLGCAALFSLRITQLYQVLYRRVASAA